MLRPENSNLKTWLKPLVISLSLVMSFSTMAKHELRADAHQHNPMREILSELDLSYGQRQDVKQLLRQSRANNSLLTADLQSVKNDLNRLVHSTDWDEAAVESTLQQNQQTLAVFGQQKAATLHQIWSLLSDQQKTQFSQMADQKRDTDRSQAKFLPEHFAPGQRNPAKLFAHLDLSEDQRAAIKSIRQQTPGLESKQALVNFRKAERALIASDDFNEDSYQALQAEYQDAQLQHALMMAKTRHDIWNVLTPEQQAKALKKMSEHQKRS